MTGTSHSAPANNNAFRCPVDHLEAVPMMARHLAQSLGAVVGRRVVIYDDLISAGSTFLRAPVVLPASGLLAEAVRRIVSGGSVVALRELEAAKG